MLVNKHLLVVIILITVFCEQTLTKKRERRYLLFTTSTQWGVFATVSIPLPHDTLVSVAWFIEANYYNVANASYFEPLLGDIETLSRHREDRSSPPAKEIFTRRNMYSFIESILERHGYPGEPCLLRLICENASAHFLHNGLVGDLIYFILTPSTSMSENDINDSFYEAEYYGLEQTCERYTQECPANPLETISVYTDNLH